MGVAVRSRAFPHRQEQTGPTLHRGAALGLKHGGPRGAEFGSEAKPKPTASGVQARFWTSSHQGCWGGCSLRVREAGGGATDSGEAARSGPAPTHPVQVPHAALLLVIFLQGVIAVELPATHTRKGRQRNPCHKTGR